MKKSILILQGGGPTSVVNSSLKGAIIEARKSSFIEGILGSRYGVEGLLDDEIVDLEELDKEDLNLLSQTPGAFLGSSRRRLDLEGEEGKKALATLSKYNVGYLLLIGGNDTMETALELSAFFLKARTFSYSAFPRPSTTTCSKPTTRLAIPRRPATS